jgi:type IV secretory pathway TraG/TraD family ATPase VirD4
MHQVQNQASALYLLVALGLLVGAGEYYFLLLPPAHTKLFLLALKFFAKGGLLFRLLLIVTYPLCFAFAGAGLQAQKAEKAKAPAAWLGWLLLFVASAFLLLTIHRNPFFAVCFPAALAGLLPSGVAVGKRLRFPSSKRSVIQNDSRKQENRYSFHFRGRDGSWVNVVNPFRGILVIGGAGSGKSYSIAQPIIAQGARKGYSGILYDFKFPTLSEFAYGQYQQAGGKVGFWVINFEDMSRTHRVNPLNPRYIPSPAYASEYALAIVNNLMPETIAKPDFWTRSAQALLTATIWYLSRYYPSCCTLPHVINMIVYKDYQKLLDQLRQDYQCASMIRSIITAVDMEASNQTAGMVSTLQLGLGRINTPEICYVLSGDEFSLDINDPKAPKMLCVGTSPTLADTFAPVISCLVTVALKLMNSQGKHHSYVLLDEGPTLYIPKFDQLPATARSNKVATIYMAQDFSQMKKEYGQNEAEAITSNLNNQFFGRIANLHTAEYVSRIFGKEDRLMRSEGLSNNQPSSIGLGLDGRTSAGSTGNSVNYSLQERNRIYPQELLNLKVGQFIGTTVETASPNFSMHLTGIDFEDGKIAPFAHSVDVDTNYKRVVLEVEAILEGRIAPASAEHE